jgi:hypothetical protein
MSGSDFVICPHCWHLNGPATRICLKCRADTTLVLQESGGGRWTAAVQSPVPIPGRRGLSRTQRAMLLGFVVLFALGQLMVAFAPRRPVASPLPPVAPAGR